MQAELTQGPGGQEMSDEESYRAEIHAIVRNELDKLDEFARSLRESEVASQLDSLLIEDALVAVGVARQRLLDLAAFACNAPTPVAFNELTKFAGYAFRTSVSTRSAFFKHTPTLMGAPYTLDPTQNHRRNPGEHIIDYARNAYHLFQDSYGEAEKRLVDTPVFARVAASIATTLQGEQSDRESILFSSAMGALDSVIDLSAQISRSLGTRNVVGQRSWFEIRQYAQEWHPGCFESIDETDTEAVLAAIEDPGVTAVILEPLANHPEMVVIDLERITDRLRSLTFSKPKVLVFDIVQTPELDVCSRCFASEIPGNLAIITIASGVKFMQAGWDLSKSGLLMVFGNSGFPHLQEYSLYEKLIEVRSVSGRAPSVEEALLADIETPWSFASRLRRYDRNMRFFAGALDDWLREHDLGYVSSPWLKTHAGHERALAFFGTGGRILFLFLNQTRIPECRLRGMFKALAAAAEEQGVSLMAAPSFGMASPHLHIVIRPGYPSSIRVSTGSTDHESVTGLLEVIFRFLSQYTAAG